jgi:putative endonuclease
VTADGKTRLVYAERHEAITAAIVREKLVKKWKREWKFALIEADNPDWSDLWDTWFPEGAEQG